MERRLDNVVYRLGFATTRREARQLVSHGHFTVNGKRVNIPSYLVKAGDVIEVCETSRSSAKLQELTGDEAPVVGSARSGWTARQGHPARALSPSCPSAATSTAKSQSTSSSSCTPSNPLRRRGLRHWMARCRILFFERIQ